MNIEFGMVSLKSETLCLPEDMKVIKWTTNKFEPKLIENKKHIYALSPYF